MDVPPYLRGPEQDRYHELLNQLLQLNIGELGFVISGLTSAQVALVTNMNFLPVLKAGTMFWVSDLAPNPGWQGITVAAVPGVSNATVKTFTVT